MEHFRDSCGGVISWLDGSTYYTAFTEGWALYAENPLIARETKVYDKEPFQKYGMLKWQVRLLRCYSTHLVLSVFLLFFLCLRFSFVNSLVHQGIASAFLFVFSSIQPGTRALLSRSLFLDILRANS